MPPILVPPQQILTPGNAKALVLELSRVGEVDLWTVYPIPQPASGINFPMFKLFYDLTGPTPQFSLVTLNQTTGAIIGAPILSGTGSTSSVSFFIDICQSSLLLYVHHANPAFGIVDIIGSFTNPAFATIMTFNGVATAVPGVSENPSCNTPTPPTPSPCCDSGCGQRFCPVILCEALSCR